MTRTPSRLGLGPGPRFPLHRRRCVWALAVGALSLALACSNRVTSENIALWKTTQKGPDKLHDALADRSVSPKLRAEAAVALVDLGRSGEVDTILAAATADERADIAKTLEPAYEAAMKDPSPEKALAYRDALFSLRQVASAEDQKRIDVALLPALESQLLAGKVRQGEHSIEKMLTAIGPDASAMLVRVLAAPDQPYTQAAELLGKLGDEAARDKGAAALIARAPKIKASEKDHPDLFYKALGTLGGPTAVKYLEAEASSGKGEESLRATRALTERRDPAVLPFALKIAGDPKADKALRDEMFGVVEGIGGLEAQKGLVAIISSDKEEIVRYRAFESVLAAQKAEGIVPGLEAFPASASYKKVDVDDLLVKLIEKIGQPARPALVQALGSRVPLARMTAVMALAQIGKAPDAPALQKLASDSAPVKGFPAGDTVGKEAAQAAEIVKKRT
ncbi:MAG TPA: HEAT repeat domain-containing protein [Polyangia bacterium]|nr:HEAT repeat domain-containing protein [Polyangia bacterium]